MKYTVTLPDELVQKLATIPDSNRLISKTLEALLTKEVLIVESENQAHFKQEQQSLKEYNDFYSKFQNFIALQKQRKTASTSKWAKVAQEIAQTAPSLGEYGEQLKKDMKEFRENFGFKSEDEE
jgi:cation transport regulator ChaC